MNMITHGRSATPLDQAEMKRQLVGTVVFTRYNTPARSRTSTSR